MISVLLILKKFSKCTRHFLMGKSIGRKIVIIKASLNSMVKFLDTILSNNRHSGRSEAEPRHEVKLFSAIQESIKTQWIPAFAGMTEKT